MRHVPLVNFFVFDGQNNSVNRISASDLHPPLNKESEALLCKKDF